MLSEVIDATKVYIDSFIDIAIECYLQFEAYHSAGITAKPVAFTVDNSKTTVNSLTNRYGHLNSHGHACTNRNTNTDCRSNTHGNCTTAWINLYHWQRAVAN